MGDLQQLGPAYVRCTASHGDYSHRKIEVEAEVGDRVHNTKYRDPKYVNVDHMDLLGRL